MAAMLKQSVSPWPHAIGFFLALLGLGYLVAHFHRDAASLAAMTIYGCGLDVTFRRATSWLARALQQLDLSAQRCAAIVRS